MQSADYLQSLSAISDKLQQTLGHTLLTASYTLPEGKEVDRIYSSLPESYPVGGRKPIDGSEWQQMMNRGECFIANCPEEFGDHFTDLDEIVALGFLSVVNIPVMQAGKLIGSINLLNEKDAYQDIEKVLTVCSAIAPQAELAYRQYQAFLAEA